MTRPKNQSVCTTTKFFVKTNQFKGVLQNWQYSERLVRYLSRYSGYDEYLTENVSSADEGISSAIQSALHQLVLNQAVTALKNGVDEMLDVLYEDTRE